MHQKQCNNVRPDSRFWSHSTNFEVVSSLALFLFASRQTAPQVTRQRTYTGAEPSWNLQGLVFRLSPSFAMKSASSSLCFAYTVQAAPRRTRGNNVVLDCRCCASSCTYERRCGRLTALVTRGKTHVMKGTKRPKLPRGLRWRSN
jgi:hypothetical protein